MGRKKNEFKREHFVFECGNIHEVWAHPQSWSDAMVMSKRVPQIFGPEFKFRAASEEIIRRLKENRDKTFDDLYRKNNNEAT